MKKFHSGLLYGLIVVDSLDVKYKLINKEYLDKTLINTANYTDCTKVSRPVLYRLFVNGFAVQKPVSDNCKQTVSECTIQIPFNE